MVSVTEELDRWFETRSSESKDYSLVFVASPLIMPY